MTDFVAAYSGPGAAPAHARYLAVRDRELLLAGGALVSSGRRFPHRPVWHLGEHDRSPLYIELATASDMAPAGSEWVSLRAQLALVPAPQFALLARAGALWHFVDNHHYCGRCGGATAPHSVELALACKLCGRLIYPTVAPCVMGLVVDRDRVLLGHNARFAAGVYSTLAGFIEVGESAEAALARELYEETGISIDIDSCRFIASQAWPFPSQLMLGFSARASSTEIRVDGIEITHAAWFERDRLPTIPADYTLSGQLIRRFAAGEL